MMLLKIKRKIAFWLADAIAENLTVGAHCGLCGSWMAYEIVVSYWPWSICQQCIDSYGDEK